MIHLTKALYTYKRSEFLPVYRNGKLANKPQFVLYKIKRTGKWLVNAQ